MSNPELTVLPCGMANNHTYCGTSYVGVRAGMQCNMMGSTMWIDAKGHEACLDNIWLAPEFASHSNCITKAVEQVKRMMAFLEATGQKYWEEATK